MPADLRAIGALVMLTLLFACWFVLPFTAGSLAVFAAHVFLQSLAGAGLMYFVSAD